jgi:hypothetical protein
MNFLDQMEAILIFFEWVIWHVLSFDRGRTVIWIVSYFLSAVAFDI